MGRASCVLSRLSFRSQGGVSGCHSDSEESVIVVDVAGRWPLTTGHCRYPALRTQHSVLRLCILGAKRARPDRLRIRWRVEDVMQPR